MAATFSELTWLRFLLTDLHVEYPHATTLYCVNQVALYIASNPVFHERTKHIELDCHLIRDKILEGSIVTMHVPTNLNVELTSLRRHFPLLFCDLTYSSWELSTYILHLVGRYYGT